MRSIVIQGPSKISGTIVPGGNKNAVLPCIAAAILTNEDVILHNVPNISDVAVMLEIASTFGVKVSRNDDTLCIHAKNVNPVPISEKLCSAVRTSFLYAGALLARCGEAVLCFPGGDMIGKRRLDSHFYGLRKLGTKYDFTGKCVSFVRVKKRFTGADLFLDEASVTATEHLLIACVLAKGTTYIRNAAAEPHVQQLAELLNAMGAKIDGIGTNTLMIEGVEKLHGAEFSIASDHIEVAGFLAMAAATRGSIRFEGDIQPRHYWMTRRVFQRIGIEFKLEPGCIDMPPGQKLRIEPDLGNAIPMISDGPWPQFPSDMMSCMIVAATQAKGTLLFFEKMFESRIYFVDRLIAMGANAVVCDPHRVVISGPAKLHGVTMSSPDIRAGMAMIVAAACARGESVVLNVDTIFRGYENIIEKLNSIGVNAKLLEK